MIVCRLAVEEVLRCTLLSFIRLPASLPVSQSLEREVKREIQYVLMDRYSVVA